MSSTKQQIIDDLKRNIAKMEAQWKEDIEREHGGGMNGTFNMKLLNLRNTLSDLENAN